MSLTSFPDRMYDIKYALFSLLTQSLKPDMIILWLAEEQFPNGENDISDDILDLKNYGLTIKWCEDIKSYKKLIPALREFPDDIIITVDDDMYYYKDLISDLYSSYLKYPDCIHTRRGYAADSNGFPVSYSEFPKDKINNPSYRICTRGDYGILYPPHVLHSDAVKNDIFMSLIPYNDDVWINFMAILNKTKTVALGFNDNTIVISRDRAFGCNGDFTIKNLNNTEKTVDKERARLLEMYPKILNILKEETT